MSTCIRVPCKKYGLAYAQNHTSQEFPYISYTGVEEPESGIFSILVAVSAIMLVVNAEMRYLFIREKVTRNRANFNKHWQRANTAGLVLAIFSSFGLLMVACFQVDTMFPPHIVGAAIAFIPPVGYMCMQTALTFKIKRARWERVWQCIHSVVTCIIFTIFIVSFIYYKIDEKDKIKKVLLLAKITELLLALLLYAFILSFVGCFREIRVFKIDVQLAEDHYRNRDQDNGKLQEPLTDTPTV
ncbi:DNA damage-regulated autophagy modulator protein 2-like [Mytilus californianus]|uniref:DNA damage-regulated autophagy modulator protein 2-like n=1 Tax=Mytilus californianus TaxID=6549 RepID=UPI002247B7CE|nr:DNA damage-regulated autophagy modulator protein 2-like [Mytilus californianus]XP_052066655.1 DNA damage-regulated autophagy modulator protein 2-like [Mytilus californianus]